MATTDLMVGIGAEYKGKAAFKKADNDILGLSKGVKTLAKAYIGLQGAQKAFRYGQASLKAFAQDDLAAKKLAKTVGNLGLSYEATNVEKFIQGLEKTFHIADDVLRPAFSKLIQVTRSYTKSKELLTTALNASAGAGVDLSTTVQDLSQAYVGNLKGLKKYNLGLTNAELATMSYQQIVELLNKTFTGQAALAADSYAYKLEALAIASNNAKEIIGKGLTNAIADAFGSGSIDKATTNIEKMAQVVADIVAGLGTMTGWFGKLVSLTDKLTPGYAVDKANAAKALNKPFDPMSMKVQDLTPKGMAIIMKRLAADKESAKRQKELAALTLKQTKALKEQTALAKAKSLLDQSSMVMNMDLIQNTAALMGKVTADEALRLKLQQAILLGNSTEAGNLAQQLLASQYAAMKLSASNPLGGFTDSLLAALKALQQIRTELAALGAAKVAIPSTIMTSGYNPGSQGGQGTPGTSFPNISAVPVMDYQDAFSRPNADAGFTATELRIFIDPSAAAYGINAAVVGANSSGASSTVNRNGSFLYGM
jgi:hypothetical protein